MEHMPNSFESQESRAEICFSPEIEIGNEHYSLVRVQRGGVTATYRSMSGDEYLKTGGEAKIARDLSIHRELLELGFPVSNILSEGQEGGLSYFTESSLGDQTFGEMFAQETRKFGAISDVTYDDFLETYQTFMSAQIREREISYDPAVLSDYIHLEQIRETLPDEAERIDSRYHDAVERLQMFPLGVCHGDLNPFNLLRGGVIDFENAFVGPIVYDTLGLIATDKFFPVSSEYEFSKMYAFSKEQERTYVEITERLFQERGLPTPFQNLADVSFLKLIWKIAVMQDAPKLRAYRLEYLKSLL